MKCAQGRNSRFILFGILACYGCARVLEVVTGPTPWLWLVTLDVLSAVVFALADGARHYGRRGILAFTGICLVVGNAVENVGIATGVPFGHYRFLAVMGPKLFGVPILLGLAYIGMAYVSWSLARILLGRIDRIRLPLVASCIMVAWDVAQDPVWSTFLHAWEWRDSGPWFGVPLSNFAGWYLTVLLIYVLFSSYVNSTAAENLGHASNWPAVAFYGLCAAGNVLQVWVAQPVRVTADAAGRQWQVAAILRASAAVSVLVMGSFVLLSVARLRARQATDQLASPAPLPFTD